MITVLTDHPVALDSPDHLHPWGAKHDNSRSPGFNDKLIALIPHDRLSLLDLGCAGGAEVLDFVNAGYTAVGIEGSDYSQRTNRSNWNDLGGTHLFTADITKPFDVLVDDRPLKVGVITAWEVLEHIAEPDLPAVFENIDAHLFRGGIVIGSISKRQDAPEGVPLHQTVQEQDWWEAWFARHGWVQNPTLLRYFGNDMVRIDGESFYIVLTRHGETAVINEGVLHGNR